MARPATGQVIEPGGKQRSWALRFRAYGKRRFVTLGKPEDGWTRHRAEAELRHVLADVERGMWRPAEDQPVEAPAEAPTFHAFASEWLANREPELRPKTRESYEWQLSHHLLPFFKDYALPQITAADVDRYGATKLREGTIAANQINKTLSLLAQILDAAGDYGLIDPARNPARGMRRRVKPTRPNRPTLEIEQFPSLLDAATRRFRPILATMAGAGLRNGEACALDWRDVNLATGTLTVRASKTDAGVRQVDLSNALRDELSELKARSSRMGPTDAVFANRDGGRQTAHNVARRLKTSVGAANERLAELGMEPIGDAVTPHSLRRLFASLRAALRDDPVYIAEQGGWTDPAFALRVYAKAARRRERLTGAALVEFDRAAEWAVMGRIAPEGDPVSAQAARLADEETPQPSRKLTHPPG